MQIQVLIVIFSVLLGSLSFSGQVFAVDSEYDTKAREALERITQEQIEKIKNTANSTGSDHEHNIKGFVLSTHIRSFKDIPANVDAEIAQIQEAIRLLIRNIAVDIEVNGGNSGSLSIAEDGSIQYQANPNLPRALNEKREALLTANLKSSVSVRSAALAVGMLANINNSLKEQAKKATTRQQKQKVYMTQAIYVYEMANITLKLLNNLKLEGKETLEQLQKETKQRVQTRVAEIEQQMREADALQRKGLLTPEQAQKEKDSYGLMRRANEQSLEAWDELMSKMGSREQFLNNLKTKADLISYKQNKAKIQIETLRDLQQVAELHDTIGSLDDLLTAVSDLDLLVLDEQTMSLLLGYNE